MGRTFKEQAFDVYANGVTLNGKPVVTSRKVVTVCNSMGNVDLCNTNCPFMAKCIGGVVNTRTVDAAPETKKGRR